MRYVMLATYAALSLTPAVAAYAHSHTDHDNPHSQCYALRNGEAGDGQHFAEEGGGNGTGAGNKLADAGGGDGGSDHWAVEHA
jgi:hypothetical protein